MPFTTSPNMSLPIPVVGQEPGPQYATDVNNALIIVDGHTHASGSGVPITPSAININAPLPMNNNALTFTSAITYQIQSSDAASQSMYMKGVDFYLKDGSGNVIRLTQSGSVAGSSGTITGLPSGTASAAFAAGTFVFQSATNTGANIDGASYILRNNVAGSKALTLQPPNAMGANYSLTLPALPPGQQIMTLDNSGNITAPYTVDNSTIQISSNVIQVKDQGITQPKLATKSVSTSSVGGIEISSSSGVVNTSLSTFTTLAGPIGVNVSSSQRPVRLLLTSDGSGNATFCTGNGATGGEIRILKTGAEFGRWLIPITAAGTPVSLECLDPSPGGTGIIHYSAELRSDNAGQTVTVQYVVLIGYEI